MGRCHIKSQRGKYPGATLNGETKLKAHEYLDLKHFFFAFAKNLQYTITTTSWKLCSTAANILLSPFSQRFFFRTQPLPRCRTTEMETLSLVSGVTRFDWTVFELQWRLWRHSSDHWGHRGPFHVQQMSNISQSRADTEPSSIRRVGPWPQQCGRRGWR